MTVARGLRVLLTLFLTIAAVAALLALGLSLVLGSRYTVTLAYLLLFGSVLLMFAASLGGVGIGEASLFHQEATAYSKNPRFGVSTVSNMYHRTVAEERGRRHSERGPFMILGFLLALSLLALALLLLRWPA